MRCGLWGVYPGGIERIRALPAPALTRLCLFCQISAEDLEGGEASLPYLAATLKVAVAFIRTLMATVPTLQQLLASGTISDINEAVNLITMLYNFKIDGSPAGLRSMLPLVFSREEAVRKAVVEATALVFLAGAIRSPPHAGVSVCPV